MSKKDLNIAKIVDLNLISTSEERLLELLVSRVVKNKRTFITTLNPEFLVFARHNPWFKSILNKANIALPDGIGLVWAGKILGQPIEERISGTDLMEKLCQEATGHSWSVYLIGGKPGVAKKTLEVLQKRYPGLKGWAEAGPELEIRDWRLEIGEKWVKKINQKSPDFLFVAFGMGKQEKFIWDNWDELKVKLAMGVGGAFDYLSGETPRAPKWARQIGLEWLYRLSHQPWRWRRQARLIEFVCLVLQEKFSQICR